MRTITALALAAIATLASTTAAHAGQIEKADRNVNTVRVSYVEPIGAHRLYVELNNGAAYELSPCRYEDGRMCYWDAGSAGNGQGHSFVSVSGRVIYSKAVGAAR